MGKNTADMLGCGMPGLFVSTLSGNSQDSLTATGSTQATALALPGDNNTVTTTAASTGVRLKANPAPGDEVIVANLGANALLVYPATGGAIQTGAANAGFSVAAGKTAKFVARPGSLNWIAMLSA
jgi:hypothetical protein